MRFIGKPIAGVAAKGGGRERILSVAAELIAVHGVDGVSIRQINAAAGVSPSTLHYHFGSLEKLVETILGAGMVPLMEKRMTMLEDANQAGIQLSVRSFYEILILPLAARIIEDEENGLRYIRFLARLHNDDHPSLHTISNRYFSLRGLSLEEMFYSALPHLPREVVGVRATASTYAMINTLADLRKGPRPPYESGCQVTKRLLWKRVQSLIDFLTVAMEASAAPYNTQAKG